MSKKGRGGDEEKESESERPVDLDSAGVYYVSLEDFGGSWAGLRRVGDAETDAPPEASSPGRPSSPRSAFSGSSTSRRDT